MSKPVHVEVVLSNSERLPVVDVWLVVDVLRASTSIVSWFASGGSELYPADSVESARVLADRLKQEGRKLVLMGEQNAIAPQGFDLGNSPLEITAELVQKNPCAVMVTTNGTVALLKAASTGVPVLIACARNAPAALDAALSKGSRVGILCSGRKGRPAWDDTLCAGLLVAYLAEHFSNMRLTDGAKLAHLAWMGSKNFKSSLMSADHAVFLDKIGYGNDVTFAGEIDATTVVPELHELPEGDGMRVVLKAASVDRLRFLDKRRLPAAPGVERSEKIRLPVVLSAVRQDENLFSRVANTGTEYVFFASGKYKKPRKGYIS